MPRINPAEILLEQHLGELGVKFCKEYRFHPKRRWRFDYLLTPNAMPGNLAVEIEGGIFVHGRHTRGKGFERDLEKYREAAALGFKVFRFSTDEVLDGTAKHFLEKVLLGARRES